LTPSDKLRPLLLVWVSSMCGCYTVKLHNRLVWVLSFKRVHNSLCRCSTVREPNGRFSHLYHHCPVSVSFCLWSLFPCTRAHTHTHAHTLTCTHTYVHIHRHTHTLTCTHTGTHTHTHLPTPPHTHLPTHPPTHTHTHTHTHTRAQVTGIPHPRDALLDTSRIASIRMGTTVATNALLERKGVCAYI